MPNPAAIESHAAPRVAVVGGGITGLAAAHRVLELALRADVALFESSARLGGVLETVARDGFLVERSADNFLTKLPWGADLCRRLGIEDDLLPTDPTRRRALVVRRGRVTPVPDGFVIMSPRRLWPLLATDVLSPRGKLRLAGERFVSRRRDGGDESVASFARRRLGREAFERLVQPLVGGIYTADAERLSMAATLPQYLEQEQTHGSLWRAASRGASDAGDLGARGESGARYEAFVAPRLGMSQLVEALAARLPTGSVQCGVGVRRLERSGDTWRLIGSDDRHLGDFQAVILATPSSAAARIVEPFDPVLAGDLAAIEYASSAVVCLAYRFDQFPSLPVGFGFVVPAVEGRRILAASFASLKFPARAPEGVLLARVFVGGALQAELAGLDDEPLARLAANELADLAGATGEPRVLEIARWPAAMPQYHVGHLERVTRIDQSVEEHAGLALAGAAYRGVGIPQCVRSGEQAAERVLNADASTIR